MEKRHNLYERDAQDNGPTRHLAVCDNGKKPIALDDVDTLANDELSSSSSPNLSPVKSKSNKDRTRQRHSHRPAFSNSNGGMLRRVANRGQNPPSQALRITFVLPTAPIPVQLVYPAFGTMPTLYMPPTATI